MLKKISFVLIIIGLNLSIANAADFPMSKIAVVNDEKVILESIAGKDLTAKIQAKISSYQKKYEKIGKDLEKERDNLAKQQSTLAPEIFEKKRNDFEARTIDFQKQAHAERVELDKSKAESFEQIGIVAKDVTKAFAEENSIGVIIPLSSTLYNSNNIDITDEILKRVNEKIKKVEFKKS